MIWVGIIGAKGYFEDTLSKLVAGHPEAQISTIMDLQELCEYKGYMYGGDKTGPGYGRMVNAIKNSDIIFNGFSGAIAEDLYSKALYYGKKIIDISDVSCTGSFNDKSCSAYPGSVYGLPELYEDMMKDASIAANPSSFCTGAILGLAPLAAGNLVDLGTAVIKSKSGITGLRRNDKLAETDMTIDGSTKVYKVESSGYAEEVNEQMLILFGKGVPTSYQAYIIPGIKGIETAIKAAPNSGLNGKSISDIYRNFYKHNPFIEVCSNGTADETKCGTKECFCRIKAAMDEDYGGITVTVALDDSERGAASQAIQTMNLMCGIDGRVGL